MTRLTPNEVKEQLVRFNQLMQKTNLIKLGKLIVNTIKLGDKYKGNILVHRYLKLNKVSPTMYNPELSEKGVNMFYSEILKFNALNAYIENLKK